MNANLVTAGNLAVALGIGAGAAAGAAKFAPDAVKPDDSKDWMAAGAIGGGVVATQVAPRVFVSDFKRSLEAAHKFDLETLTKIATKNLPMSEVASSMDGYLKHHSRVEGATLRAASTGVTDGLRGAARFGAIATAGAAIGVGALIGWDKLTN